MARLKGWGLTLLLCAGCASSTQTFQGEITVRGQEPFPMLMLSVADTHYVLVLSTEERHALQAALPARFEISGDVYEDRWMGRVYPHLRVKSWSKIN